MMGIFRSDWIARNTFYELDSPEGVSPRKYKEVARPLIICLIGSSRFKAEHEKAQAEQTLLGKIVLPMGMYGHLGGLDMDGEIKKKLDRLHLHKIDLADEVFVVNPIVPVCVMCRKPTKLSDIGAATSCCSSACEWVAYIGDSTKRELLHAQNESKIILWLNKPNEKPLLQNEEMTDP